LSQASSRAFNDRLAVPAITVVIPVFNRAHSVGQAISSVFAQDVPGWSIDVVVVDDGSSDDLDGALRQFGEGVACIRHVRNKGAAAARNTGIAAVGGAYVAFLDSDDTWLPGKLAAQINFMETHGHRASCTAYLLKRPNAPEFVSPRYATGALGLSDLVWGCFVSPGSTLVCRREVLAQIGGYDVELQRLEDWDWLLRYTKIYPLGFLAQPLARIDVAAGGNAAKAFAAKHASIRLL
jgi:glycosyltransferase involved in cell wall biosynthesis